MLTWFQYGQVGVQSRDAIALETNMVVDLCTSLLTCLNALRTNMTSLGIAILRLV